jgi:serine-type D-Ala-D-Ala carboxypeptidase (penicillin-binding protein 5/6)
VLLARNADARLSIASITKLMTALIASREAKPNELVTVDGDAAGVTGSTINLRAGEQVTVKDLLAGALIQSANDSAVALGEFVAARVGKPFATQMNDVARAMALEDTHFVRPDGLDVAGHYSTARDVTVLAMNAMRVPVIRQLVRQESATISGGRTLHTWNDLLGEFPGVFGVKTGHTSDAGWSQVAAVRGNGVTLYATILGSPARSTRNADLEELMAWGLSRFALVPLAPPGRIYGRVPVTFGREAVPVVATRPLLRPVRIGRPLVERVVLPTRLELPVRRGQVVGELRVFDRRRLVGRSPLVAAESRDEPGFSDRTSWYAGRAVDHVGGWFR